MAKARLRIGLKLNAVGGLIAKGSIAMIRSITKLSYSLFLAATMAACVSGSGSQTTTPEGDGGMETYEIDKSATPETTDLDKPATPDASGDKGGALDIPGDETALGVTPMPSEPAELDAPAMPMDEIKDNFDNRDGQGSVDEGRGTPEEQAKSKKQTGN